MQIVDPEFLQTFNALKTKKGIEITPEDSSFCSAQCYPVLIGGRLKGAIVIPLVKDYPENKMELIASQNIKAGLFVATGDVLEVEVL